MFTRVALFAASLAASAALAVGLALFGLTPAAGPAEVAAPATSLEPAAATASDQAPAPITQMDTVYVVPPTAKPTPEPTPTPIIVNRVVTSGGGEHEDAHEGGDDD
ncbi:MAG: hypothetical protein U0838_11425 [Chloroflexota bacterium]